MHQISHRKIISCNPLWHLLPQLLRVRLRSFRRHIIKSVRTTRCRGRVDILRCRAWGKMTIYICGIQSIYIKVNMVYGSIWMDIGSINLNIKTCFQKLHVSGKTHPFEWSGSLGKRHFSSIWPPCHLLQRTHQSPRYISISCMATWM